jgi:hypothetical protein
MGNDLYTKHIHELSSEEFEELLRLAFDEEDEQAQQRINELLIEGEVRLH